MKFITNKHVLKKLWGSQVFRHLCYWFSACAFIYLNMVIWESPLDIIKIIAILILPAVVPVYLHFYIHKRFFEQRRYLPYILLLIVIIIGAQFLGEGLIRIIEKNAETHAAGAAMAIFAIIFTTSIKYYREGVKKQSRLQEAESKQLQTELALLKSQVNPHFFFNTLNNLYALSLDKSERVPEVILKISDLMRYVLESSNNKMVELNQEINFLQNYLSLERLRLSANNDVKFNIVGRADGKMIAPMLLILFIENSFKHGVSASMSSNYVHIDLKIEGNELFFSIENNKRENYEANEQSSSKSGLKNVTRRLELLYPDRHKLDIEENKKSYKVNLKIKL